VVSAATVPPNSIGRSRVAARTRMRTPFWSRSKDADYQYG
jgi:hypothetical protein